MIRELEPGRAIPVAWSAQRYHADRGTVSRGQLVDLIDDPPRYYALHEARVVERGGPTRAMSLGTLAHLAVLESGEFERRVVKQVGEDAVPIGPQLVDQLQRMRASVMAHSMVAALATNTHVTERTILWRPLGQDVEVGGQVVHGDLVVRVRPDLLVAIDDDQPLGIVADLKTTASVKPREFARSVAKYRYHLQAALYRDAVAALFEHDNVKFIFIAVAATEPHEVACYDLDEDALELGRNQYRRALVELVRRRHTGDWSAPWHKSIHTLSLPRWARESEE